MRRVMYAYALATALGLAASPSTPATAHFLGYSAVDANEIRYGDSTSWDDARNWAVNSWCFSPVTIAPDDIWSYEDLTWKDANRSDVSWDGVYINQTGADDIFLNSHYLNSYSDFNRRAVAAHEQGHALGLAHSYSNQLMNSCATCSGYNTPQSHDVDDYHALWGY